MPPAKKRAPAKVNKVDVTVENQEKPVTSDEKREATDATSSPEVAKMAPANEVDETVENQMNPVTSDEERESTDPEPTPDEVPKMAPANEVDETVHNQMNPGLDMVDRHPEPVIREDDIGVKFDVSKPFPEIVDDTSEEEKQRKAVARYNSAALRAKDVGETEETDDSDYVILEFVESGLTAEGHVWKKGEFFRVEDTEEARKASADTEGNVWYELSANEQEERYGKVFFERR